MPRRALASFLFLAACVATAGDLDDLHWREEFTDTARWTLQPSWLTVASTTASVASDGQVACFRVDEPRQGMKWSATMPIVGFADAPWLVVRYRAENLDTGPDDYLVYLDDRVRGKQLNAIRLRDAKSDGQWHTAAVDVTTLTEGASAHGLAVQVRATAAGKARLWIDWLAFMPDPPKDAEIIRRGDIAPPKPDWAAPLAKAKWTHHNSWLSNPASAGKHSVKRAGEAWVFRVAEPGRGMKWSWDLPKPTVLAGHRYVAMRYRARGLSGRGDYALCVIGKPRGDGSDYASIIGSRELVSDGRWHTAHADILQAAARFTSVGALAIQAQAESPDATLEVVSIRLVNARQPAKLSDFLDWQPRKGLRKPYSIVPIAAVAKSQNAEWRRHLRIADWFTQPDVTVHGIPFRLHTGAQGDLAGTAMRAKADLRIPAGVKASEVYLLLLAALTGTEEPCYGSGAFRVIRDVDRVRLRLEYADGTADECLPMRVPATRGEDEAPAEPRFAIVPGPQVLVAAADPSKTLKAIVLRDIAKQAAFALAGVTARTGAARAFPQALEHTAPLRPAPIAPPVDEQFEAGFADEAAGPRSPMTVKTPWLQANLRLAQQPTLDRLVHRPTRWPLLEEASALMELRVNGTLVPSAAFTLQRQRSEEMWPYEGGYVWTYAVEGYDGLVVEMSGAVADGAPCTWFTVTNRSKQSLRVALVAPKIGPYRLCERPEDAWYLVPRRGAAFDNRPRVYRERYCGTFPVQFLHTFSPSAGRGLSLRTEDTACIRKRFLMTKDGGDFTLGVEYPELPLKPGEQLKTAPTVVQATDGDWHRALTAYREWTRTWHRPLSPRKPWFREIFNFRQRFLHALDPLYDHKTGQLHLQRAVDEARAEFGGIDYLHLFDWGNCDKWGRIYGRTGDYSPYDFMKGGLPAFRKAIAGVQAQGVPTGLYIEGYLLTARGRLGQAHGKDWQSIRRDGKGAWWPGNTEMSLCAGVKAWREVQASTYHTKVKELDVDGMYIDQFGFANVGKDCWSKDHGHPVPSYCVRTERDTTQAIRERIEAAKKNVAVYTEETPVDVTTQFQDGSFTYAMRTAHGTQTRVPLNIARFAFPDFKTIEILYCDKPTGSWATGVKWVFFNGEAIWLEGPAVEWFEPETRATIRRCYRILRKHKDAFTSLEPVPLVPTEMGGVWANKFPVKGKTVYTLYNARHRTVRGGVLRVPHRERATYTDAWHRRPATIRGDGEDAVLTTELGPHGVGCIVVEGH